MWYDLNGSIFFYQCKLIKFNSYRIEFVKNGSENYGSSKVTLVLLVESIIYIEMWLQLVQVNSLLQLLKVNSLIFL